MKIFKKPIFVSISPNAQVDDVWLALKLFFMPWKWKEGKEIGEFEKMLGEYLNGKKKISSQPSPYQTAGYTGCNCDAIKKGEGEIHPNPPLKKEGVANAVTFESGRTALYAILQALGIREGDEVLIQCFTCTAAVNPTLWVNAKPVYVDVEEGTFNMSPEDLEKKITPRSKVVIIQHTFGFPAKVDEILETAQKHNLIVLEDCAHSLGAEYKGQKVGTFGEASFFSFGRSKVISSVFGGASFTRNPELAKKIREIQQKWQYPSYRWIAQQLFHPIYLAIAKPLYNFLNIGKMMIIIGKKLGLISIMVYSVEKSGGKPPFGPAKMPNALAVLALNQMRKLERFNEQRRELAGFYRENLDLLHSKEVLRFAQDDKNWKPVFVNFPIQVKNFGTRWKLIGEARRQGIYLESWPAKDKKVIGPDSVCQEKLFYNDGDCPTAEKTAQISVNLPTHPNMTMRETERVIRFLRYFFGRENI